MCIQVVEVYAVCRCVYYTHEVDRCALYGQRGHKVSKRIVDVGYACPDHSAEAVFRNGRVGMTERHARHHGDDAGHCGGLWPIEGEHAIEERRYGADAVPHWLA
jgi:hypothetical protein